MTQIHSKSVTRLSSNWLWLPTFLLSLSFILPMLFLHNTNTKLHETLDILRPLPIVVIALLGFCWLNKKKWVHSIVGNSFVHVTVILWFLEGDFSGKLPLGLIFYPLVLGSAILITLSNHFLSSNRKNIPNNQGFLSANNYVRLPSTFLFLILMMLITYFASVDGSKDPLRFQIFLFILLNLSFLVLIRYNKEKIVHVWIGLAYVCVSFLFLFDVFPNIKIIHWFSYGFFGSYISLLFLFVEISLILLPNLKIYLGHNQEFFRIRKGPYELFPVKFSDDQLVTVFEIQELEKQDMNKLSNQTLSLLTAKPQELFLPEDVNHQRKMMKKKKSWH